MNLRHRIAVAIVGFAALVGVASLVAQLFTSPITTTVNAALADAVGGNAFTIDASLQSRFPRLFKIRSDQAGYPRQSNLVVLEDGKPLGPPHAVHVEIDQLGSGRYSHWVAPPGSVLIFSASDNSDLRKNGRKYEISARALPVPLLMVSILLLPIFLLVLQRLVFPKRDMTAGFVAAVSLVGAIAWGSLFFNHVILAPDSTSYIRSSYLVPLGYPLFLDGVTAILGSLDRVAALQAVILVAACAFVALSAREIVGNGALVLSILMLLLCCLPMFWWTDWILSEGMFTPLSLLNLAAAFFLLAKRKVGYSLLLVVAAALMMFVRPAGYYVVAGIVFLMIAQRGRFTWMLKWACVPFVVCAAATILINVGIRGNTAPSQFGRLLFPTVAFLFEPQFVTEGLYRNFVPVIEAALKPHRDGYRATSGRAARITYLTDDYNARLTAMDAALTDAGAASFKLRQDIYLSFALTTIARRPVEFATQIAEQIIEAWDTGVLSFYGTYRARYLAEVDDFSTHLNEIKRNNYPLSRSEVRPRTDLLDAIPGRIVEVLDQGYHFIRERRWLIYFVGIVTFIAIPVAVFFRRESLVWLSLGYCGVMIHGSMLLTTGVAVFIPRYAVAVDPVILIAGAIMVAGAIRSARFGDRLAALSERVQWRVRRYRRGRT